MKKNIKGTSQVEFVVSSNEYLGSSIIERHFGITKEEKRKTKSRDRVSKEIYGMFWSFGSLRPC